jgi:type II secretory pathway pseudopilin PulG
LSIPQAFDPNASTPSAQNRACRGGRPGCKILPSAGGTPATIAAFSLVELLVVITIIIILAGLILSTVSYVRKKGARARAETEIAAMSAAIESYKADNGIYPRNSDTDGLDPTSDLDPTSGLDPTQPCSSTNKYTKASLYLYEQISGDTDADRVGDAKSYFAFTPAMLHPPPPNTCPVIGIRDPFGNSYGYSTMKASDPTKNGYNPTFDLWSAAGGTQASDVPGWIKNW